MKKRTKFATEKESEPFNDSGLALYYENELGGLSYNKESFSIYSRVKNRKGKDELIVEERKLTEES